MLDVHLDQKGFLWIGTERGLSRFDGHSFKNFYNDPTDSTSMYDHFVLLLEEDSKGIIWIVTRAALIAFDPALERFETILTSDSNIPLAAANIDDILIDTNDFVWITTYGEGLARLDPATREWTRYTHVEGDTTSLPTNVLYSVIEDAQGYYWVGLADEGLARLDPDTEEVKVFRHDPADASSIPPGIVVPMLTDSDGKMWFGSDSGIFRYDEAVPKVDRFAITFNEKALGIWSGLERSDGSFWLVTEQNGIVRFDPHFWRVRRFRKRSLGRK